MGLWGPQHRNAVKKIKESLTNTPALVCLEMNWETAVAVDASNFFVTTNANAERKFDSCVAF